MTCNLSGGPQGWKCRLLNPGTNAVRAEAAKECEGLDAVIGLPGCPCVIAWDISYIGDVLCHCATGGRRQRPNRIRSRLLEVLIGLAGDYPM